MSDTTTGVIPETLMYRNKRREVIAFLITQPWPGYFKRDMLLAWARTVVVRMKESEVQQVIDSGHK